MAKLRLFYERFAKLRKNSDAGAFYYVDEYDLSGYSQESLPIWIAAARHQEAKDKILIPRLARFFRPGRTLELGAGAGQTALLLQRSGWDVIASDYVMEFVEHMLSIGLRAHRVDALDISGAGLGKFANIYSQSISPFITSNIAIVEEAYRSSYDALEPEGRLVMIHAMAPYRALGHTMKVHREIAERTGFRDVVVFRNQALPSRAYRKPLTILAAALESLVGRSIGIRFVLIGTR